MKRKKARVDILERFQFRHANVLVNFMNGGVRRTQFNNLWTKLRDEAAVAGAARGGKFRLNTGFGEDRLLHVLNKFAGCREER